MLLPVTAESVPYVALAVFCCLACGFFLFVLYHWMQDSSRSKKPRPTLPSPMLASHARQFRKPSPQMLVSGQQPRVGHAHVARPRVVSLLATDSRAASFRVLPVDKVLPIDSHPRHPGSELSQTERAAYERIANCIQFRRKA
jgi:hypothetical protein